MNFLNLKSKNNRDVKVESIEVKTAPQPVQTQKPGDRIASVMSRMYRLIVSADLDMNSCYVEAGDLTLGETELPRKGTYDDFIRVLSVQVAEDEREEFAKIYSRTNLHRELFNEKSYISDLFTIEGKTCEVRVEKIPELKEISSRVRCCLYVRPVLSKSDNGSVKIASEQIKPASALTESDKLIGCLFVGSYEFSVERNYIIGYRMEKDQFRKLNDHLNLKNTIEGYIQKGLIAPESAATYQNLFKAGMLEKKTAHGTTHIMQVKLKSPGATQYLWYEEIIYKVGNAYRVYRRNIDEYRKTQETKLRLEEQTKYANYNRTMLENMASLVEFRNVESGAHVSNVRKITETILEDIAERSPKYGIDRHKINIISEAATIHDIGKITIPDSILNKPAHLTDEEFDIMRTHTSSGSTIIDRMSTEELRELYDCCRDVVLHHHERYDGKGYPEGLSGDNISIAAQVVGIADAFDALVSERCYKQAYPHDVAFQMIVNGECGKFSDRVIESLKASLSRIREFYDYTDVEKKKEEDPEWQENSI